MNKYKFIKITEFKSQIQIFSGTAIFQLKPGDGTTTIRQKMFDNHETTVDHVMHIVGLMKKYNGDTYYLVKNS